ncbi:hypothetical protein [Lichenifustis flavocetrariae]|uniref:Uncharacterized protein n=1 Tax=Lichenifustis flavocetrariae TaxID=2949735 RepID=A0AA41YW41_9HYPH|nr:hypothetical protein [Lichenifustis flavocetrariae]MCW6508306.1 hypothetical protein [Lichenifustis flavocetrariae]
MKIKVGFAHQCRRGQSIGCADRRIGQHESAAHILNEDKIRNLIHQRFEEGFSSFVLQTQSGLLAGRNRRLYSLLGVHHFFLTRPSITRMHRTLGLANTTDASLFCDASQEEDSLILIKHCAPRPTGVLDGVNIKLTSLRDHELLAKIKQLQTLVGSEIIPTIGEFFPQGLVFQGMQKLPWPSQR